MCAQHLIHICVLVCVRACACNVVVVSTGYVPNKIIIVTVHIKWSAN